MIDKNLFLYDLAIVAIFKNEARYLKEWIDYHLLAGVDHFYLYNNDSTDDYKEILAPYVDKNLVTLTEFPGKAAQVPAYADAVDKYCFYCRYMAFIDIDEFILPKSNRSIVEVVDEILSRNPNAASLTVNWQCFGSNGHEQADYSRGVLERFTRRAPKDWGSKDGNFYTKIISNPRLINYVINSHAVYCFDEKFSVNSAGTPVQPWYGSKPILVDKIIINHYQTKSKEEFLLKQKRGRVSGCALGLPKGIFNAYNRNEVFDDGILKYRAAREENFYLESNADRINRVSNALVQTLLQTSTEDFPVGKLETFLICRAVAEKLEIKIDDHSAEELALARIYRTLSKPMSYTELQLFIKVLPEILARPFSVCKEIYNLVQSTVFPNLHETLKNRAIKKNLNFYEAASYWRTSSNMIYLQKLLRLIK